MNNNESEECCGFIDNIWDTYKKHSGKISIALSVCGTVGSILINQFVVIGSIVIGITNVAVFFSGIAIEKLQCDLKLLIKDNNHLQTENNEMIRKLTIYKFPDDNESVFNEIQTDQFKIHNINDYLKSEFFETNTALKPNNSTEPTE